jgi:hypothetical protein
MDKGGGFYCELCDFHCNTRHYWDLHKSTERHSLRSKKKDFYCEICDFTCNTKYWYNLHLRTPLHMCRK